MLTIVAAMAVTAALRSVAGDVPCRIKWPNDVVVDKKKVCGILTEMSAEVDYIHYVVIGIGINVNTTDFDDSIKDMASSVYLQTGKKIKRSSIVVAFAKEFTRFYDEFLKTGDLSGLADEYNEMLINAGQQVKISDVKTEFTGTAIGINNHGELLVRLDDGSETAISAGEVSVRGLYGYV
jgi:BirA family biotin operon repressor/biotin-[acetyl-CoA-carboxylase] ligase